MARHLDPQDVAQVPTDRLGGRDAVQALRGRVPGEDRQVGVEDPDRVRRGVDDLRRARRNGHRGVGGPGRRAGVGGGRRGDATFGLGHARYPTLAIRGGRTPGSFRTNREEDRALSWPLTDEERLLRDTAREFARRSIAPTAIERDEAERFDRSIFAGMGELGLAGAPLPESVGGGGFSYLGWTLVMEEIGAADLASAVSLSVHILSQYPVVTWGTAEQHERWLGPMVSGEALGAFALTEPHAGSDAAAIRTRAERVGPADAPEGYRLTGTKIWITNAPEAERYLVFAIDRPVAGSEGDRRLPRRAGDGRLHVRRAREEDGDPGVSGGRARVRGLLRAGREPARRARARATGSRCRPWPRAGSRSPRRASAWPGPRSSRRPPTSASEPRSAGRSPTGRRSGSSSRRWPGTSRRPGR